ncbi:MAG TPA: hypothetical protein VI454_04065, partial [Verrucomicrobiae bacterium]
AVWAGRGAGAERGGAAGVAGPVAEGSATVGEVAPGPPAGGSATVGDVEVAEVADGSATVGALGEGPPPGSEGSLTVGPAVGLGGSVMRTVSFLG